MSSNKSGVQQPTITEIEGSVPAERTYNHPAYGQIRVSRVSGGTNLYGIEYPVSGYISVEVMGSTLHRDSSEDWPAAHDSKIILALSEAQWANMISSVGIGAGTQCTIQRIGKKLIPGLPDPRKSKEDFSFEMESALEAIRESLNKAHETIQAMGLSKAKSSKVESLFEGLKKQLNRDLNFIGDQFDEHMENVTDGAKHELYNYVHRTVFDKNLTRFPCPHLF